MPIYMDRHDLPGEITAEDVAKVHQEDLKIQSQYGCRGLTYWFDEKRGTAFCLIEAPDKNAVKEMHDQAHGMIPNRIIEVDSKVVNAFLGRIQNPSSFGPVNEQESDVINESAFRTIMFSNVLDFSILKAKFGKEIAYSVLRLHNEIVRKATEHCGGREVKCLRDGFIASFCSSTSGLECARVIQKELKDQNKHPDYPVLQIRIGISAGPPVSSDPEFFGSAVHLAQRLCYVAGSDRIIISAEVKKQITEEEPASFTDMRITALTAGDEEFLNRLMDVTESVWNEEGFNVCDFGKRVGSSKAQLYRKTTMLCGYSPNNFMKEYRLRKAAEAIEKQQGNTSEIAYKSGFSSPSYFTKCFNQRFGILPSSFAAAIT